MILKRRKTLSLLIAGILSLSLAACGGNTASTSSGSSAGANDAGGVSTASDAASAGDKEESAGEAADPETNGSTEGADSMQDSSAEPSYKTADYVQDEIVIADTDQYKLTVTGFDPEYVQDDYEGFLVHLKVENKTEKEYSYIVTAGSVNHTYVYNAFNQIQGDTVVSPGESAELGFLITSNQLEEFNISSVDAVSVDFQAMSSEFLKASESGHGDVIMQPQETDLFKGSYAFSPTGVDYESVAPPAVINEETYDLLADNDVLTLGVKKNEDGSANDEENLLVGFIVHTDNTEIIRLEATDVTVNGTVLMLCDENGSIIDFPFMPGYSVDSNTLVTRFTILDHRILEANNIDEDEIETLQFTLVVRAEDGSELYNETLSYSLK